MADDFYKIRDTLLLISYSISGPLVKVRCDFSTNTTEILHSADGKEIEIRGDTPTPDP